MPKSPLERLYLIGASIAGLAVVLISYLFFISPQRDNTSQVSSQVSAAKQRNDSLAQGISELAAQNKNLGAYERALASARLALPTTSGLPEFLRTLQAIGNATLANVSSLTVGAPAPLTQSAPVVAKTGPSSAPAPSPSATPAGGTPPTPPAPSIYSLPISLQVTGTPSELNEFLRQLQSVQPRAVLISQITETNSSTGTAGGTAAPGLTSLQLTMAAFVAPGAVAAAQAVVTGTP